VAGTVVYKYQANCSGRSINIIIMSRVTTGEGKLEIGNLSCQGKVRGEYFSKSQGK